MSEDLKKLSKEEFTRMVFGPQEAFEACGELRAELLRRLADAEQKKEPFGTTDIFGSGDELVTFSGGGTQEDLHAAFFTCNGCQYHFIFAGQYGENPPDYCPNCGRKEGVPNPYRVAAPPVKEEGTPQKCRVPLGFSGYIAVFCEHSIPCPKHGAPAQEGKICENEKRNDCSGIAQPAASQFMPNKSGGDSAVKPLAEKSYAILKGDRKLSPQIEEETAPTHVLAELQRGGDDQVDPQCPKCGSRQLIILWNSDFGTSVRCEANREHYFKSLQVSDFAQFFPSLASAPKWECAARKAGSCRGNEPQDCNYPFCGCDPNAEKIIEALQECGWGELPRPSAVPAPGLSRELTGEQLKEIALRHNKSVAGFQFSDKFDFDAIAAELNALRKGE